MDWATVEEGGEVAHLKDKAQRWGGAGSNVQGHHVSVKMSLSMLVL